jgi:hypothetical protein
MTRSMGLVNALYGRLPPATRGSDTVYGYGHPPGCDAGFGVMRRLE